MTKSVASQSPLSVLAPRPALGLILLALVACKSNTERPPTDEPEATGMKTLPAAASASTASPTTPVPTPPAETESTGGEPPPASAAASGTQAPAAASAAEAVASSEPGKPTAVPAHVGIQNCCHALDAAAKKGGLTRNKYLAASGVCKKLAAEVKAGNANLAAVRTTLRAQLQGAPRPGGC